MTRKPTPLRWTPSMVARFWEYQTRVPQHYFTHKFGPSMIRIVRKHVPKNSHVLDYGSGHGNLIPHLIEHDLRVTAVDLTTEIVEDLNRRYTQAGFLGAETVEKLTPPDIGFDAILALEVIEHLDNRQLVEMLDLCRSWLRRDGKLILSTPNQEVLSTNEVYCPSCNSTFHRWQHVRSWSESSVYQMLNEHGFKVVYTLQTDFGIRRTDLVGQMKLLVARLANRSGPLPHLLVIAKRDQ